MSELVETTPAERPGTEPSDTETLSFSIDHVNLKLRGNSLHDSLTARQTRRDRNDEKYVPYRLVGVQVTGHPLLCGTSTGRQNAPAMSASKPALPRPARPAHTAPH